jgi:hypothetical protein
MAEINMDLHRIITKIIIPPFVKIMNKDIIYKPWVGFRKKIPIESIQTIQIKTTDRGPLFEDFFIVIETKNRVIRIAQEVEGFGELLSELQKLSGFDNETVIKAASCVENAVFNVWQRKKP